MPRFFLLRFLFCLIGYSLVAQQDSLTAPHPKRKIIVAGTSGVLTVGSLVGLQQAWYKDYNTGSFHFFDDNAEWLQMDKAGHFYTTYQMGSLMMEAFDWAGYSKPKTVWIGGSIGFAYMTAIECMDGFSRGWGFSWGDQLADALGTGLAMSQRVYWNEQRIQLKFSFSPSGLAGYNPKLLGNSLSTQVLKDYNGQTYWMSLSPTLLGNRGKKIPVWLNLSLGYGAYGMLGGHYNNVVAIDKNGQVLTFDRERRWYLSADIDLSRIKTKHKLLKKTLLMLNMFKFPLPAVEFTKRGVHFYPLYY